MDEDLTEIQVRFVTKLDASVPDTTFSLPVRLQRYGLSGVVNHLLAQGSLCTDSVQKSPTGSSRASS
jgi:hypothetical protein